MNNLPKTKAYVTGIGVVSPLGEDIKTYWCNLIAGRAGIGKMTLCDPEEFPSKIAGEVNTFRPENYIDKKESKRMARFSQMAVAAAAMAIENSNLKLSSKKSLFDIFPLNIIPGFVWFTIKIIFIFIV